MFLVNKAKGIHKPADLTYALSVRQSLSGPYEDTVSIQDDGRWVLDYNQEGSNSDHFTNRALLKCMDDRVPVGVLVQVRPKPASRYKVLGLGLVTDFNGTRFRIEQYEHSTEVSVSATVASTDFDANSDQDARKRELRAIAIRRGQPAFRRELIEAYGGRCAISNCDVLDVLEAAHIIPFKGAHTNHVQNGILLRADLHTLFDLNLLCVDAQTYTVRLSPEIAKSEYAVLEGKMLVLPADTKKWPSKEALSKRYR
jgi:hypothetical protein